MRAVLLFPGQGSQFVGMGKELYGASPRVKAVYDKASLALGFDMARLSFEGPESFLVETRNTQPAILTLSIAVYRELEHRGLEPIAAAGHSLGEYSAYVAAGSLSFEDAVRLVRKRGELMFESGQQQPGTMAAVLGLDGDQIKAICESVEIGIVCGANLNSPGQTVISGEPSAVEAAMKQAKDAGAKRVVALNVSGAFHSPLMESAREGLAQALKDTAINAASIPVVANASGETVVEPEAIRKSLADQLTHPVLWESSMRTLIRDHQGSTFLEAGPGKVLKGLMRAIDRSQETVSVGDPDDLTSLFR